MLQGKFRFSLDGVDATARQFGDLRRQLRELSANVGASVGESVRRLKERVAVVEAGFESLTSEQSQVDVGDAVAVVVPAHGGTGVRNVCDNPLSVSPRRTVYCGYDGVLGVDCSRSDSVVDACDADGFVPLDAIRRVRWRVYFLKDDVNLKLDDAQPVVGLVAEDLDEAGLGFFCEYDMEGNPTGVDYARLSVAALRLAQEAMDEVDGLKALVGDLSSRIDRMEKASVRKSDR